jgi:hypothetical protein
MPVYKFMTGEVYSVDANDSVQAERIIKAFFDGEWDEVIVTSDDINGVQYEHAGTMLLGEAEPGKMYNYYIYEE